MPEKQTSQTPTLRLRGSGLVEVASYSSNPVWKSFGAITGLKTTENMTVAAEEVGNAAPIDRVTVQDVTIELSQLELLDNSCREIMRGGFDNFATVAGTETTDSQVFAADSTAVDTAYELEYQMGDGTLPVVVVSDTVAAYVDGTDYELFLDSDKAKIIFIAGGAYDATKVITIATTYTPAASIVVSSGDKSELPFFMVRITTKNDGRPVESLFYRCQTTTGEVHEFKSDNDEADRSMANPISITARQDTETMRAKADGTLALDQIYKTIYTGGTI